MEGAASGVERLSLGKSTVVKKLSVLDFWKLTSSEKLKYVNLD